MRSLTDAGLPQSSVTVSVTALRQVRQSVPTSFIVEGRRQPKRIGNSLASFVVTHPQATFIVDPGVCVDAGKRAVAQLPAFLRPAVRPPDDVVPTVTALLESAVGDLDFAPIQENGRRFVEGMPEIYIVSNVKVNGEAIGSLGDGEAVWHTDMSYLADPPKASMLYALEIPPSGGDTGFANMYAAYESLPDDLKRRAAGLRVKHDGTYNSGGYVRQGVTAVDNLITSRGAFHPLVCTHAETKRRVLYLGRRRNAYIDGLSLPDSESLLDQLWSYATREEFAWHNEWRVGDLVLWDNRCTMHRRDPFDETARRIMHRTQIKGETRPSA